MSNLKNQIDFSQDIMKLIQSYQDRVKPTDVCASLTILVAVICKSLKRDDAALEDVIMDFYVNALETITNAETLKAEGKTLEDLVKELKDE